MCCATNQYCKNVKIRRECMRIMDYGMSIASYGRK